MRRFVFLKTPITREQILCFRPGLAQMNHASTLLSSVCNTRLEIFAIPPERFKSFLPPLKKVVLVCKLSQMPHKVFEVPFQHIWGEF